MSSDFNEYAFKIAAEALYQVMKSDFAHEVFWNTAAMHDVTEDSALGIRAYDYFMAPCDKPHTTLRKLLGCE